MALGFLCGFLAMLAVVVGQSCTPPAMRDIEVVENFDFERFMGKWYEIKWVPDRWFDPIYDYEDYMQIFDQLNDTYARVDWVGRDPTNDECLYGSNELVATSEPGKLKYNRIVNEETGENKSSDYWVIETDYDNFGLVYGCRERDENDVCTLVECWVWSRERTISDEHRQIVDGQTDYLCIAMSSFFNTSHISDCPYPADPYPADVGSVPGGSFTLVLLLAWFCMWTFASSG